MRDGRIGLAMICAIGLVGCPNTPDSKKAPDTGPAVVVDAGKVSKAPPPPLAPGPPSREATKPEVVAALKRLKVAVKTGASEAKNPWSLAHGLVGFGKRLKANDGRLATKVIVTDFLETNGGLGFPLKTTDDIPVEPHPDLMLKSLLGAGVKMNESYTVKRPNGTKRVKLADIAKDAEKRFREPTSDKDWRAFAWSFSAFVDYKGIDGKLANPTKTEMRALAKAVMARVDLEQRFLMDPLQRGRPDEVVKRRQGIFAHTCGGLHLVQAAVSAAAALKDPGAIALARQQLEILLFRWDAERRMYRALMAQQPKFAILLRIQELKFYGHVVETFALAREAGVIENDPILNQRVRLVLGDLVETVNVLAPAYEKQLELKKVRAQTYYDLIGDGCHAIRGLERSLGLFFEAQP